MGKNIGKPDLCKRATRCKSTFTDIFYRGGHREVFQQIATGKGIRLNGRYGTGKRYIYKIFATIESILRNCLASAALRKNQPRNIGANDLCIVGREQKCRNLCHVGTNIDRDTVTVHTGI